MWPTAATRAWYSCDAAWASSGDVADPGAAEEGRRTCETIDRTDEMLKRDRRSGCGREDGQPTGHRRCRERDEGAHPFAADAVEEAGRERVDLDGAGLRAVEVLDDERELP